MKLLFRGRSITNLLLYLIVILSFISYENKIYISAYQLVLLIVLFLGIILFFFGMTEKKKIACFVKNVKNNILVYLLSISLLVATLGSSIKLGSTTINSLMNIILTILSVYIFYIFLPIVIADDIEKKINKLILFITFFSIISVIIAINGRFMWYRPTEYGRVSSVFFDPNYYGTISAIGFILSIYRKGKYKLISIINLASLFYSGSRAAMISMLIPILIFYFYNKRLKLKNLLAFIVFFFMVCYFVIFLLNHGYFRTDQGLNSRDVLWKISIDLIKKEPLWGYGYGAVSDQFKMQGVLNSSSHNFYLDYILTYGIPSVILNIMIIIKAVYSGFKNRIPADLINVVLLLLLNMNSIYISLGGLGAVSLLYTFFLGLCNFYKYTNKHFTKGVIKIEKKVFYIEENIISKK